MIDQMLQRFHRSAPVAAPILMGLFAFGGFGALIALAVASYQDHERKDAKWWARFRVEHNCKLQNVLPGSAGFLNTVQEKVAWNCNGEIYLRYPR